MKLKEAIVLAGGLGTRLRSVVKEQPKSMAAVNGRPFLEYLFDHLIDHGISRCILSVGYKSESISEHFGDQYKSCTLEYVLEEEPLGTGGAIKNALQYVKEEDVLITNGDSLFLTDIQKQFQFHLDKGAKVTLALLGMKNFVRYGTVELDEQARILNFKEKQPVKKGLINGGVYIFQRDALDDIFFPTKFSIENDFFQVYTKHLPFYGFISNRYFLDIGIPSDFSKAQDEFKGLF